MCYHIFNESLAPTILPWGNDLINKISVYKKPKGGGGVQGKPIRVLVSQMFFYILNDLFPISLSL